MAALEQVIILFLLIVVGYIIKKLKVISNDMNRDVSNLVMNVALPAFIIKAMNFSFAPDVLIKSGKLILISACVYSFVIAFSFFVTKLMKVNGRTRDVYQYVITFSNVGYMGYPVTKALLGDIGVFYAALYNISFNVLTWTIGVYYLTRDNGKEKGKSEKDRRISIKKFINPGLVAVITGFILFLFSIELPYTIYKTLDIMGSLTTPLAMIFIGSILADVNALEIFTEVKVFIVCAIRLLILPILVMIVLKALGFSDYLVSIPVIITAMPAAANAAIMASRFNNDYYLTSKVVFLSTFFSVFTIPIIVMLINS
ncbi:AEC family transporter [Wukongibacter sp. M2B1]|uniref:AEC family transporter n=1 Tax=Wukongibacter sp. M2B1 TaxID=3088895 RepID=UPI003D78DA33